MFSLRISRCRAYRGAKSMRARARRRRPRRSVRRCEILEPRQLLAAGELDPTFDADGWATTDFGLRFDRAFAVEIYRGGPLDGRIVAAQEGQLLATSFHPELTGDDRFHRYFLSLIE